MNKIALCFLAFSTLIFASCEDKDDDKVFSAQQCLDKATPATVDTCVGMVAGISTSKSYVIRCSADFIRQNITNSTIVDALENLDKDKNQGGTDPNVILYDFFVFSPANGDTALGLVNSAVANCAATGSETLQVLALSAKSATVIKSLTGGASIEDWLNTNPDFNAIATGNPEEMIALGETILAVQPIACGKGGSFEDTEVCTNLNNSIDQADATEIAKKFLDQLKQQN
jgi:putative hemolysin